MSEPIAWTAALIAAGLAFVGIWALTRPLRSRFLRIWLRALSLALMLTPAPVPNFEWATTPPPPSLRFLRPSFNSRESRPNP